MTECVVRNQPVQFGLTYLAEGAANVVYKIKILPESGGETVLLATSATTSQDVQLSGKLLRLRKKIPSAVSCIEIVDNFNIRITKLFGPGDLINLELFKLPPEDVIADLNNALRAGETTGARPAKRRGVYLAPQIEEENGILVTDMTPQNKNERFVEFKPKWLLQSPSAPRGAKRCRTCALREMRRTAKVMKGRGDAEFCPLDLLNPEKIPEVVLALKISVEDQNQFVEVFEAKVQPLLLRLRDLQVAYASVGLQHIQKRDHGGPPQLHLFHSEQDRENWLHSPAVSDNATASETCSNPQPKDFQSTLVGMTLRDCSVFIKFFKHKGRIQPWEVSDVRLADLDLKSTAGGKLEKWAQTEKQLLEGRWYEGTEDAESRGKRYCSALRTD